MNIGQDDSSQEHLLHAMLCRFVCLILARAAVVGVIRNTHSRTQVLHQRDSILATEVNKLDTLDPRSEVDTIALWVIAMLCSIQIFHQHPWNELPSIRYTVLLDAAATEL